MSAVQMTETAKVTASTANAEAVPAAAIKAPPSAGPASRAAIGRASWSSEFACVNESSETRSGTRASKAGP
jgi:hypothetical protein